MKTTIVKESYLTMTLNNEERSKVAKSISEVKYDADGHDQYIAALRYALYSSLPRELLDALSRQRSSVSPYALINVENLPIDDNVTGSPAPGEASIKYKAGNLSENIVVGLSSLIGEPYSIFTEGKEIVANLTPEVKSKAAYDINGSEVELDYHIENSALRFLSSEDCAPVGVALLGVRHDENGPLTRFADTRLALQQLSEKDIKTLYSKNFIIKVPHRWRGAFFGERETTDLSPILTGPKSAPRVSGAFYKDITMSIGERAQEAFNNLHQALKAVEIAVDVRAGSYTYVDNRFAFHSRDKFVSSYDENERPYRWLQRVYVAPNLWNYRSFSCNGYRVYDPASLQVESFSL